MNKQQIGRKKQMKKKNKITQALFPELKWNLKPECTRLDVEVFFRGMGGHQDTVLALVKLYEADLHPLQYHAFDGDTGMSDDDTINLCGEASIGFTFAYMPDQKDYLRQVYETLFSLSTMKQIKPSHWLNDVDQYSKIQARHRCNTGKWSRWYQYYEKPALFLESLRVERLKEPA
jgi:hypothetical protein